jgi:putative nucleotidyltransferase with HDIG domain
MRETPQITDHDPQVGEGRVSALTTTLDEQRARLAVASRLSARLAPLLDHVEIAKITVAELHHSFAYYFAVIQRLDPDGVLRLVAGEGPLADATGNFLSLEQPIDRGVNGRVARSGAPALVIDTRLDEDYLQKDPETDPRSELAVPILVAGRVWGVLNLEQLPVGAFGGDDLLLADTVAAQVGAAIHRLELFTEVEEALVTTLGMLTDALERQDEYTALHAEAVAALAEAVGRRFGLAGTGLRSLRYAALLHDVGKIGVRSDLLTKPGPLSAPELVDVQRHAVIGAEMLARVPFFSDVHPIVRASHERWDGDGYPEGLAAEAIPLGARIVLACDALHAMTSDRSYRAAMSRGEAVAELRAGAGSQFDPAVIELLLQELQEAG